MDAPIDRDPSRLSIPTILDEESDVKNAIVTTLFAMCVVVGTRSSASAQSNVSLTTDKARGSYAAGQRVAESLKTLDAEYDIDALLLGIRDALENKPPRMSHEDIRKAHGKMVRTTLDSRQKKRQAAKAKHARAGKAFRAKSRRQRGQKATASGLQYRRLKKGRGARPTAKNRVRVRYKATLIDGTEFDNSDARGNSAVLPVDHAVRGLAEGLKLMETGSTYRFVIPPELAYGDTGVPGRVPPGATLIYKITLLGIEK